MEIEEKEFIYSFPVTEPWLRKHKKQLNEYRVKLGIKTKEEDFVLRCILSFDWRKEIILGEIEKVKLVNDSVKIIFNVKAPRKSIDYSCSHPFREKDWSLEVNTFYNRASYVYYQIRRYII
jgi:hypothetical protein